ncbi:MAG: DUF433 domain-containing protein [Actinomycetota bacterium]
MAAPSALDRELYEVSVAAGVLRVPPSTLRWWLEGGERRGKTYPPVLRAEPTGSAVLTWGEVVEAGYLAGYRKALQVKLWRLREFMTKLRTELKVPYPLATARPWVGPGRRLLLEASEHIRGEPGLMPILLEPTTGQEVFLPIAEHFLARVEFDGRGPAAIAARIRPLGKSSPVVIDPEIRFGVPAVGGVSTSVLKEKADAGEPVEALADAYGLTKDDVIAALAYEATDWPHILTAA